MNKFKELMALPSVIASLSGVISFIVTLGGALFWIDSRYAHAETVLQEKQVIIERQNTIKNELTNSINEVTRQIRLDSLNHRILDMEDRLYVLDAIPDSGKSSQQRAEKERLERRLNDLQRERQAIRQYQ